MGVVPLNALAEPDDFADPQIRRKDRFVIFAPEPGVALLNLAEQAFFRGD